MERKWQESADRNGALEALFTQDHAEKKVQAASSNSMERTMAERHEGPSYAQKHTGTYKENTQATQRPQKAEQRSPSTAED